MNFDLSEEQLMLADAVDKQFAAHAQDASAETAGQWRDYADLGLLGLPFAEDQGGFGGGHEEVMLVMEAYGRHLGTAPYRQSVLLGGRLLATAASDALAPLIAGQSRLALGLFEQGNRYGWESVSTIAERTDEHWYLTGRKIAVEDADADTAILCLASTPDGAALFMIPPGAAGLTVEEHRTPDGRPSANIALDGVMLPDSAMLSGANVARDIVAEALDGAIVACCAEMVGAMEKLLSLTTDYLNTRKQFGVAIGSFQVLQHRAADMLVAIEQARSMTIYAVSMMEAPADRRSVAVAAAKALVNQSSRFVGTQAVQLHGGMGLTSEYPAGRYFQRLTTLENMFGDTDHHLSVVEAGGGLPA